MVILQTNKTFYFKKPVNMKNNKVLMGQLWIALISIRVIYNSLWLIKIMIGRKGDRNKAETEVFFQ